ncbi:MAG: hypothetical protein OES38_12190 [Gammaproteobacteria bacterium]|nr:hypothetical protein [Gammaproteobacteria bacterium]
MDESKLLWGLLFGAVGIGYLVYGRRQRILMPFLAGVGLLGFPYFVDDTGVLLLLGVVLVALPFVVKL